MCDLGKRDKLLPPDKVDREWAISREKKPGDGAARLKGEKKERKNREKGAIE